MLWGRVETLGMVWFSPRYRDVWILRAGACWLQSRILSRTTRMGSGEDVSCAPWCGVFSLP